MIDIIKNTAKRWPGLYGTLKKINLSLKNSKSHKSTFTNIFKNNSWGGKNSVSGEGSDFEQIQGIIQAIPVLVKKYKMAAILDAPCGDFYWMKQIINEFESYLGMDIVDELIASNNEKYSNDKIKFQMSDIRNDSIPEMDVILCRDCFIHLPNSDVIKALKNFKKSSSNYLLTTTCPLVSTNIDIAVGQFRQINLEAPPFNLPKPIELIDELCTIPTDKGKSLGLWELKNIPV